MRLPRTGYHAPTRLEHVSTARTPRHTGNTTSHTTHRTTHIQGTQHTPHWALSTHHTWNLSPHTTLGSCHTPHRKHTTPHTTLHTGNTPHIQRRRQPLQDTLPKHVGCLGDGFWAPRRQERDCAAESVGVIPMALHDPHAADAAAATAAAASAVGRRCLVPHVLRRVGTTTYWPPRHRHAFSTLVS